MSGTRRKVNLGALTQGALAPTLALDELREHADTQPREAIAQQLIEEYADDMVAREDGVLVNHAGQPWPAVVVYASPTEAGTYWLADGYHRVAAARRAGLERIQVELRDGELRDAILHSVGANSSHGLRRSRSDARRAVRRLLLDDEWRVWSNEEIARRCAVSPPTVAKVREQLQQEGAIPEVVRRMGADGRVQYTRHQGRVATFEEEAVPPARDPSVTDAPRPTARQMTARWDELATLRGAGYACAVCHWETPEQLRRVAELGPELLAPDGALVLTAPQGDHLAQLILAIEQKKRACGLRGPVIVVTGAFASLVVWVGGERSVPPKVASLADLITRLAGAGKVLHVSSEGGAAAL